ncbi:type II toxin-antitoxin system HipA family toxin YjjJ [Cystobacter ferrugineus]|uniref:Transcriptional regulator n=1 Tax=Cystobacter ferrugineus TaxID=83449 RepID=A0A1L9AXM3_9BACT|nr:type II toxin-antitoxin system HipA family toxin YjjJ [Cystobacter ferrugineus]OJH34750.1 transcriptional regulator [Cystobacter ferrugineus]
MSSLERMLGVLARLQVAQAKELASELGVSQPTVSRLIQEAGERVCRMGQTRATRYARTRSLPRLGTRQPLHRISETGKVERFGEMHLLEGGHHWFTLEQGRSWLHLPEGTGALFEGLPPFIVDMCPQGYVGRTFSRQHPELGLPLRLGDWNDDHHLIALAVHGADCVGNLILGEDSLNQWLAHPREPTDRGIYPELARRSDREQPGSSAGGEHPKFLTFSGGRHVLVKFASSDEGAISRRWRDLLVCESLALEVIREAGIEAATAHWFDEGDYRFLEVERFDRVGERGRRGMISLKALDNEYIGDMGPGSSWTSVAPKLQAAGFIHAEDARRMRWLDVFGQLTGNDDRHFGNLSFLETGEGRLRLAPTYDMLPMRFVPSATAVVDRPFVPDPPTARTLDIWPEAAHHASLFWTRVIEHEALSDGFRALARQCREALEALRERLPL